jgi:general secretion pathway protein D
MSFVVPEPRRDVRGLLLVLATTLLVGCAQQRLREEADVLLRQGQYEQATTVLQGALSRYPDSAALRSGLLYARNEALARLLVEASTARAAGRLDDAAAVLQRARTFDAQGRRVTDLLQELEVERRQRLALRDAEQLVAAGKHDDALQRLAMALRDNPRQPDLLALQRRLETSRRQARQKAGVGRLAESRPISLDFREANLRQVLELVTRHSGVSFILDKDVPNDMRVTTNLRSIRVQDAIDLLTATHRLASKVVDPQTVLIYPNTPEKLREHQEQVLRVFYLTSAEAKGAAALLRSMLRVREPFVDERANMLALREPIETIELAERLIALYDSQEPEVLLELEVIEVRSSRLTDLGIRFPDTIGLTPLPPAGASGLTLGNLRGFNDDRVGVSVAGMLLSLRREVGDFNTLANPRIRARNREKATVLIGDKVPIVTATTGQGGFVSDSVAYLDVGLKLAIEPTVYPDDEVGIRVNLEVSSLGREVRTSSGSLAFQVGTRNAATALRLRDGETQLLAGLISRDERSSANRVPGLGDLPVAGRLFSSQRDESQRTELVLAITPRIIRNVRKPEASETELWVGTEASTRLRPWGAQLLSAEAPLATAGGVPSTLAESLASSHHAGVGTPQVPDAMPHLFARWLAPPSVRVGESFEAVLDLDSTAGLRGLNLRMRLPEESLELLAVEEGDYLQRDGHATSFTHSVEPGGLQVGILRNEATPALGRANVLRLKLRARSIGAAELAVTSMEPGVLSGQMPSLLLPAPLIVNVRD